jgi:hypothetical protein
VRLSALVRDPLWRFIPRLRIQVALDQQDDAGAASSRPLRISAKKVS